MTFKLKRKTTMPDENLGFLPTLRETLAMMGYTEKKPKIWLKPIGYQLLAYKEETNEWVNWLKAIDGEICCWETRNLHLEDQSFGTHLRQLKEFESHTRLGLLGDGNSNFELGGMWEL